MQTQPTCFINARLSLELIERIKAAARRRAVLEARHVPYVYVLREALEQAFPASSEEARRVSMNQ